MRRVIEQGSGVLGICLGAQMIAQVLGARVLPNAYKEIGWFPVFKTQGVAPIRPLEMLPTVMTPFHWHGETFDIPAGAAHAFGNQTCLNQGFVYDERVVALQFHLEITPDGVRRLIENCPGDLDTGPFVQDPAAMTSNARAFDNAHMAMHTLLDEMEKTTRKKALGGG
jgi:GMP synthase (glutamine-hydrolysing)